MPDPTDALSMSLRALTRFMVGDETPREGLLRIARLGEGALAGAAVTGMTLLADDGTPKTFAFTGSQATDIDQLQYDEGDGPCLAPTGSGRPSGSTRTSVTTAGPRSPAAPRSKVS